MGEEQRGENCSVGPEGLLTLIPVTVVSKLLLELE